MKRTDPIVIVSKGNDPYHTTLQVLQKFPLPDLQGKKILLKPNAARLSSPGDGVTTHPLVVSATIDHLREKKAKQIAIGEGFIFGVDDQEAFEKTGFKDLSAQKNVALLNLDQFDPIEKEIPQGKILKKVKVSSALNAFDYIISIPVMKTHMHTLVSLSLKNMKGVLWRKEKARLHQLRFTDPIPHQEKALDYAISEMATLLMPDLVIIDGTIGMEGMGPAYGQAKKTNLILVSNNAVSGDAVASRLMGFHPEKIPHLKLCAQKGLGKIQLHQITIKPHDYQKWENPFKPPPTLFSLPFPDVRIYDDGSCSGCLSTLLVFLQEYLVHLDPYRLEDHKIHIGMGKHLKTCPKGSILIGNCVAGLKRNGIFIKGCPPVSSQIMETLSRRRVP